MRLVQLDDGVWVNADQVRSLCRSYPVDEDRTTVYLGEGLCRAVDVNGTPAEIAAKLTGDVAAVPAVPGRSVRRWWEVHQPENCEYAVQADSAFGGLEVRWELGPAHEFASELDAVEWLGQNPRAGAEIHVFMTTETVL